MKKNLTILIFTAILSVNFAQAQTVKTSLKVVTILPEQGIYLNGATKSYMGGKSRTYFKIDLPQNTVEWYYVFSTTPASGSNQSLQLTSQLTRLIDPTGLTAIATASLFAPSGSGGVVDIYFFDMRNRDYFMQKDAMGFWKYEKPGHFEEGSVENEKQGKVKVDDVVSGTYYLGLRNPSGTTGVNITFEVAAIVKETEQMSDEQSQAFTLGNLGWKAFERGDYDRCLELSQKALELDNSLGFVHFNIALSYLIKGQNTDAVTEYTKAISFTRKSGVPKQIFEGAIDDLKTYMDKFPSKPDAEDILELLNQELKKY